MKITQDVRDYAAKQNARVGEGIADLAAEVGRIDPEAGMEAMSAKFKELGGELYIEAETAEAASKALTPDEAMRARVKASNKALG
jgi:phosphomethylpyrimidine synthase